ncbi:hypothetical protein BDZ91DRAFT_414436 [Kalaharituber pfeilii]|nr:hypothetical protein BDZ91DRAFT_414436 [Kalaharituber pfeilii]
MGTGDWTREWHVNGRNWGRGFHLGPYGSRSTSSSSSGSHPHVYEGEEAMVQWALVDEAEQRLRDAREQERLHMEQAQLSAVPCGSPTCWCTDKDVGTATMSGAVPVWPQPAAPTRPDYELDRALAVALDAEINSGHAITTAGCPGHGCGHSRTICTSAHTALKNTENQTMYWAGADNKVQEVKPGDVIPHYSKIKKVYNDGKWIDYAPNDYIKNAQGNINVCYSCH